MCKRILSLMVVALLVFKISVAAFAEEIERTTTTESSTETKVVTNAVAAKMVNVNDSMQTDMAESTDVMLSTEVTNNPTQANDEVEPTDKVEAIEPTNSTEPNSGTESATPTSPTNPTEPNSGTESTTPTSPTNPTEPNSGTESTTPTSPANPTEPNSGTESTYPTSPTNPTEEGGSQIPTSLEIDTENIYEGMDQAYEDGYVPKLQNGMMHLVIPLRSNGEIYDNKITVSLNLGSSALSPFEIATYEKTFEVEKVKPQNSGSEVEIFLVEFVVKLAAGRTNGVYPVAVNVSGYDDSGFAINYTYTLYVTITDGKSSEPAKAISEIPTAEPVVYISDSMVLPGETMAGEEFILTLTLKNSLTTKSIRNMLVKVDTDNIHINLLEDTNIFQIDKIAAGGEATLTLHCGTDASIPAGKYTLNFTFNYDSSKTLNLSSSGTAIVEIQQPANMELVMPRFPQSVTVGETIPLSLQVMNMGRDKMYNVRCVVSGYGFSPANTGYIGTMSAGTAGTTKVELYIIALNASKGNESGNQYGDTEGTVTLIYEDETGEEFSQKVQFETVVNRPVVDLPQRDSAAEEEEKTAGQWWISVIILGGVLCVAGIGLFLIRQCRKNCSGKYL